MSPIKKIAKSIFGSGCLMHWASKFSIVKVLYSSIFGLPSASINVKLNWPFDAPSITCLFVTIAGMYFLRSGKTQT
jgi:hypothetical protein